MASLDKQDAILFTKLCGFVWSVRSPVPLIFNSEDDIYVNNGINFSTLKHLDAVGLISFESLTGYKKRDFNKIVHTSYGKKTITLEFPKKDKNDLSIGHAIFTEVGLQLVQFCKPSVVSGFEEYVMANWLNSGVKDANRIMYQGTIIEDSLSDKDILKQFRVNKTWQNGDWTLHSVSLDENQVEILSRALDAGPWYIHIWKRGEDEVKVLYKDKVFDIKYSDKATWADALDHGKAIGIPEEQLDFPID
jgi:hypothetical protein